MRKKECKTPNEMLYSKNRKCINESIISCLQYLKNKGFVEIVPFIDILTNNGFKHKDVTRLILKFLGELENDVLLVNLIIKFLENYDEQKELKMLILEIFKKIIENGKTDNSSNLATNIEEYTLDEEELFNDYDQFLEKIYF